MVKRLHSEGSRSSNVVYNHTAEGNHPGPTISFRGIDNASYYRLVPNQARYYMDYTGCANTLNVRHPRTLQLITDSLRYWVQDMHIDGCRFDLASALAREFHDVDRLSAFFDIIRQDPILSQVKDRGVVGSGRRRVPSRKFPPAGRAEWNGRYRDTVRRYWRGDGGQVAELGFRLTGSSDLYERSSRRPYASINFMTSDDGFTLHDLVSYNEKHNEENRDGTDDNLSWNCGAEGPTDDPAIRTLRQRQKRNMLATLLLSQGVPMLCGGDEMGRTQQGNNNVYCQDDALSWYHWDLSEEDREPSRSSGASSNYARSTRPFAAAVFFKAGSSMAPASKISLGSGRMEKKCRRKIGSMASSSASGCASRAMPSKRPIGKASGSWMGPS